MKRSRPTPEKRSPDANLAALNNLKAFRRAQALASDLFWVTRRFPATADQALVNEIRVQADAMVHHVSQAWLQRTEATALHLGLSKALKAGHMIQQGLDQACAQKVLATEENMALQQRTAQVLRLIQRLRLQKVAQPATKYRLAS